MKKLLVLLVLVMALGFSCKKKEAPAKSVEPSTEEPSGSSAVEPSPVSSGAWTFEMGALRQDGTGGTAITYVDGRNRRMDQYEGVGKDKKLKIITISTPEASWVLTVENKTGTKMPAEETAEEQPQSAPTLPKWSEVVENVSKDPGISTSKKGMEKWEGADYTVYHLSHPARKAEVDYYVDSKDEIKRIVSYDSNGRIMEDVRMDLKFGPLPADTFKPPSDYQIKEMGTMK
jgi:hypothetical protein